MSNYFPEEIWYDILKRMPSKSICRFLSVCKTWYRLITSKSFISSNLNHNLNTKNNTHVFLYRVFLEKQFLFYPQHQTNNGEIISKSLGVPSLIPKFPLGKVYYHDIIGSCNGLICFNSNSTIILWNPSIQKFVKLPHYSLELPREGWEVFGIGINLLNQDFKVIRILGDGKNVTSLVEVYSLITGLWRQILGVSYNFVLARGQFQLYLNGRSHWIGGVVGNKLCSIISFDMSDEVFQEVSITEELAETITDCRNVAMLVTVSLREREYLGVVIYYRGLFDSTWTTSIWVMKEYGVLESWTRLYFFDDMELTRQRVLGFMKNGNILMDDEGRQLTCYDPVSKLLSDLDICGSQFHAGNYMESLVLLEPLFKM